MPDPRDFRGRPLGGPREPQIHREPPAGGPRMPHRTRAEERADENSTGAYDRAGQRKRYKRPTPAEYVFRTADLGAPPGNLRVHRTTRINGPRVIHLDPAPHPDRRGPTRCLVP